MIRETNNSRVPALMKYERSYTGFQPVLRTLRKLFCALQMYLESQSILQERPPGPLAPEDMYDVLLYQNTSVQVTVSPLAYNPDKDAEVEPINSKIAAEDLAWERQRGTLKYKQWKAKLAQALELGTPAAGATVAPPSPYPAPEFGQGTAGDTAADDDASPVILVATNYTSTRIMRSP